MSRCSGSPGTAPRTRARRARGRDGDGRGHRGGAGHAIATMTSVSGSAVGETPVVLISTLNQDGPDRPHDRQRPDPHWAARIAARYPIYGQGVSAAVPARRPTEPRKLTQIRDAGVRPGRQCLDVSWGHRWDRSRACARRRGPGTGDRARGWPSSWSSSSDPAANRNSAARCRLSRPRGPRWASCMQMAGHLSDDLICGRARGAREHGRALVRAGISARGGRDGSRPMPGRSGSGTRGRCSRTRSVA